MPDKSFGIPACHGGWAERELNAFISNHRVREFACRLVRSSAGRVDALPDGTGRFPVPSFFARPKHDLGRLVLVAGSESSGRPFFWSIAAADPFPY